MQEIKVMSKYKIDAIVYNIKHLEANLRVPIKAKVVGFKIEVLEDGTMLVNYKLNDNEISHENYLFDNEVQAWEYIFKQNVITAYNRIDTENYNIGDAEFCERPTLKEIILKANK